MTVTVRVCPRSGLGRGLKVRVRIRIRIRIRVRIRIRIRIRTRIRVWVRLVGRGVSARIGVRVRVQGLFVQQGPSNLTNGIERFLPGYPLVYSMQWVRVRVGIRVGVRDTAPCQDACVHTVCNETPHRGYAPMHNRMNVSSSPRA